MATFSESLVSSSARKLRIRKRPDLSARRQRYQGKTYWVVKDPVGLHYFRFQEEEFAILQMLDGETSLDEIKERFEAEFPPQKITLEELQQFLGMLHRSGLIIADVQGQGTQLLKRRGERRRQELLAAVSNILCIRFKGIDPERILTWLYPKVRWFFTPWAVGGCIVLALAAATLVAVQFDVFRSKLPGFYQFFSPANAFLLAVTLAATKVLHEFGHGLSCKHFGGECHEMGVMILVLTPCLYCNVSDSWMLPNKWHRAAIGAAGMYVELVLASIATFVWWYSSPGLVNNLALNVMFICSVSTVVFNANPLLRYDGYYILADILEIPNLRQKATTILSQKAGQWFLGLEPQEDPFLPQRRQVLFALYSVAAAVYRWLVVFSILWFLYRICKHYKLEALGWIVVALALAGLVLQPLYRLGKFFYVPGRLEKVKKPRMYASLAGLVALAALVVYLPLPYSVLATVELQARDADSVYVDTPGLLDAVFVQPGQWVEKGQALARLKNLDLELEIARLQRELAELQTRLRVLEYQRVVDEKAAGEIPPLREAADAKRRQLEDKCHQRSRLTLTAPKSGYVLPPPWTPKQEDPAAEGMLPAWHGSPLEPRNLGALLDDTVLFCQIGDPRRLEAILVIDQADIEFVRARQPLRDAEGNPVRDEHGQVIDRPGQRVEIKLDELPHDTLEGEVFEVSRSNLKVASRRLSAKSGGELATKTTPSGAEVPLSTSYQARVPLDDVEGTLRLGLRGRAKIHMDRDEWQTLGQRLWRVVTRTFNFKL